MSRFSDLEDVYNTLISAKFDFNTLPATNKYRKYYEWKTDPEKRTLPEGSAQEQGPRVRIGLHPFGRLFDADKSIIKVSGRANTQKNSLPNGVTAALGHTVNDLTGFTLNSGYKPAKVILANKLSNAVAVSKASNRITGKTYKRKTGETFIIPFGRVVANDTEFDAQDTILAEAATTYAVTFQSESLSRRNA